jgi:hypothetical protein
LKDVNFMGKLVYDEGFKSLEDVHKRVNGKCELQCPKCWSWMTHWKRLARHKNCGKNNTTYMYPKYKNRAICQVCGVMEDTQPALVQHMIQAHREKELKNFGYNINILKQKCSRSKQRE